MFSWEAAAASVVEPLWQDPAVCGPTVAPPSVLLVLASLSVSLISFSSSPLPPSSLSSSSSHFLLHLVLPHHALFVFSSVTVERGHFLSAYKATFFFFQLPTFFTFHFQQNVSVKIFSFSCLTEDQEISTDGNVNIRPDDLLPRPHLAG